MFDISWKNRHIIVVYHYVEPFRSDRTGIHPCAPEEFERQISFLSRHYRLAPIKEVFNAARSGSEERMCAITFDDGLKGQFIYAAPILRKFRAPATFFMISSTLDNLVPFTHKVHILLSLLPAKELRAQFHLFIKDFFSAHAQAYHIPSDRHLNSQRMNRDIIQENLKERIVTLPRHVRERFLNKMFHSLYLSEAELSTEFFMNENDIYDLAGQGFSIGSHTHCHEALDIFSDNEIRQDITKSKKRIETILTAPIDLFCYPYGRIRRNQSFSAMIAEYFSYAVTTETRALVSSDDPVFLPRYRMNDVRDFIRIKQETHARAS